MQSPYANIPTEEWKSVTWKLVDSHPLKTGQILESALQSWSRLWNTRVGDESVGFPLAAIDPPATVIGYMFEKLFAKELAVRCPGYWRGGVGSEKDLHYLKDETKSVEMKASGQLGYKIFGNRSYGQTLTREDSGKKDKSGFYITVNFFETKLTLLRFGWIDSTDWKSQKSATGQMAGLPDEVYVHKLIIIPGEYMLDGPVKLLKGVGSKAATDMSALGVETIGDLLRASNLPAKYEAIRNDADKRYGFLIQNSSAA
jgi:hypothetical protein